MIFFRYSRKQIFRDIIGKFSYTVMKCVSCLYSLPSGHTTLIQRRLNVDATFYIVKLGFTGVYIIFLNSA